MSECLCPENTYRDRDNRDICHPCGQGLSCGEGSDMREYYMAKDAGFDVSTSDKRFPLLVKGYWSSTDDPLSVFECADEDRCPGGNPGTCMKDAEKSACSHCKTGRYSTGRECSECSSAESSQFIFPILPLVIIPIIICVMYWFFRDMPNKWGSWQNCLASLLFLLLNHFQMISLSRSVVSDLPLLVLRTFNFWGHSEDIISIYNIECAGYGGFQTKFVIKNLGPIILLAIAGITGAASRVVAKFIKAGVGMDFDRLCNIYFSIIYSFFVGIASMSMLLFKCKSNPNGKKTLIPDLSVICHEAEWSSMLGVAIVSVALHCCGLVALFSYVTLIAPKSFASPSFQKRWKFLFIKYRLDVHWWGTVFLLKGLILNLGPVVFTTLPGRIYWMLMSCSAYLAALLIFLPWRIRAATILDGSINLNVNLILSLLFWFADYDDEFKEPLSVFTVVVSCLPFCYFLFVATFVLFPVLKNLSNPEIQNRKMDSFVANLKQTMTALSSMEENQLKETYLELSQNDQKLLRDTMLCLQAEFFGAIGSRLSGRSKEMEKTGFEAEPKKEEVVV